MFSLIDMTQLTPEKNGVFKSLRIQSFGNNFDIHHYKVFSSGVLRMKTLP